MNNGHFLVRAATRLDYNLLRYGLKQFYWPLSPLSLSWKNYKIPSFMEYKWTMTKVLDGQNLIAFDENNLRYNFIGFAVNTKWSKNATKELLKFAEANNDERLMAIGKLQNLIEIKTNIYEKYNTNEILLLNNIGVHPEYYCKKIGSQLIEDSLNMAKNLNNEIVVINATGKKLQKICENNDMTKIGEIKLSSVIDENTGKKLFNHLPEDEDDEIFIYVRQF